MTQEMQINTGLLWFTSIEMSNWMQCWTCSICYFPSKIDCIFFFSYEQKRLVCRCVIMLIRQQNQEWTRSRAIYYSRNRGLKFRGDLWERVVSWKKWMKYWFHWSRWNVAISFNRDKILFSCFCLYFHMSLFLTLWTIHINSFIFQFGLGKIFG